jgi:1,2-diacylglycerol 3-alpha-glucosyltransferase
MRIAMYTDTFFPSINGVAVSIATLANALAEEGHQVFIQAPRSSKPVDTSIFHPNITTNFVRSFDARIYPDFRIATGLPLSLIKIRQFNPDVIHVHTPFSLGIEGLLIGKRLNVPIIYTFHTYFMDPEAMKIIGIRNTRLASLIQKGGWRFSNLFCAMFDAIIAPSQYVAKDLKKHGVKRPIVVCPNMLGDETFSKPTTARSTLRHIIFVGRLSPEKRVHLLLHTLARLQEDHPELILDIVGDGIARNDLFDLSFELGVSSKIHWHGQIPHHELISRRFYHVGDLFLFLSRFETQGLVTLEAMAHGLPVIATASTANREVIGTGGIVLTDTPDEEKTVQQAVRAIRKACEGDLSQMRNDAYSQAEKYRVQPLLPLFTELYQETHKNFQKDREEV